MSRPLQLILLFGFLALLCASGALAGGDGPTFTDDDWVSMGGFAGVDKGGAMATDGAGNLYVAVNSVAGDTLASGVAKWDGEKWSPLGTGISGSVSPVVSHRVSCLLAVGGELYAAGRFTTAGGRRANSIAKWDGTSWSALGSGIAAEDSPSSGVKAMASANGILYVAGEFESAGGAPAVNVAAWDGTSWSSLGEGLPGRYGVYDLELLRGELYACGPRVSGAIARWNGTSWTTVGGGVDGSVSALETDGRSLYVGGSFTSVGGGVAARNVAMWTGTRWLALGSGIGDYAVNALAYSSDKLFVGGEFSSAGGVPAQGVACWHRSRWSALGSGVYYHVTNIAADTEAVYVTSFSLQEAGGLPVHKIAKWDGEQWSSVGSGSNGSGIRAVAVDGTDVYVGGEFTTIGGISANHVAKWDGRHWSALGEGLGGVSNPGRGGPLYNTSALALEFFEGDLYVGGVFTTAGGKTATKNVARWDGAEWFPLGQGVHHNRSVNEDSPPAIYALEAVGDTLYAGGNFDEAGGAPASLIAAWDGTAWSPLGAGVGEFEREGPRPRVYSLTSKDGVLYAGGLFTAAGGLPANNIAAWNGTRWSTLGGGTNRSVHALQFFQDELYAGGEFWIAGGVPAETIARWDGSRWSPVGAGLSGLGDVFGDRGGLHEYAYAFAVSEGSLYVGGAFLRAGWAPAEYIARWDGSDWSPLGSGMGGQGWNRDVFALGVAGDSLYVGGEFHTAGRKASPYLARAVIGERIPELTIQHSNQEVTISWPSAGSQGYELEQTSDPSDQSHWQSNQSQVTNDGTTKSVTVPVTKPVELFRLRKP